MLFKLFLFLVLVLGPIVRADTLQQLGVPGIQVQHDTDGYYLSCIAHCENLIYYALPSEMTRHFPDLYETVGYWNWLQARAEGRLTFTPLPHPNEPQPVLYELPVGAEYVRWPAGIARPH